MIELPDGYHDVLTTRAEFDLSTAERLQGVLELLMWGRVEVRYRSQVTTQDGWLRAGPARMEIVIDTVLGRLFKRLRNRLFPPKPLTAQSVGGYCPASGPGEEV